jgi:2-oxoglutarate ferredoxin oxidoreductase subunit alpha
VPQPLLRVSGENARYGVIYYGSTSPAMAEAIEALEQQNLMFDTLRVRAFPFPDHVADFILAHSRVFVVEQNRDGQLRTLLVNEFGIDPARLLAVLHYDGTPITARFIVSEIGRHVQADVVTPLSRDRVA